MEDKFENNGDSVRDPGVLMIDHGFALFSAIATFVPLRNLDLVFRTGTFLSVHDNNAPVT